MVGGIPLIDELRVDVNCMRDVFRVSCASEVEMIIGFEWRLLKRLSIVLV